MLQELTYKLLVTLVFFFINALPWSCAEVMTKTQYDDKTEQKTITGVKSPESGNIIIELIELERRNWESHGTDTRINAEGNFEVYAVFLGKMKKVRAGTASSEQMYELARLIENSHFFTLPNEFKASFKTQFKWWGYQLKIKTKGGVRSVRFHSEDETVPVSLKKLVETIMDSTK
jgi:hypothetical protein